MNYRYGMRLRGYSIGCQPEDVKIVETDSTGRYYDILTYNRELTDKEIKEYELDDLNLIDRIQDALFINNTYQTLDREAYELKKKYEELFKQCEEEYEDYSVDKEGASREDLKELEKIENNYAHKIYDKMRKEK